MTVPINLNLIYDHRQQGNKYDMSLMFEKKLKVGQLQLGK